MKSVLIIVPSLNIYPPANDDMQRCFHVIHQLSKKHKLTLIIEQPENDFLRAMGGYIEIKGIEIYSLKDIELIQAYSNFLSAKFEYALRYRWYKRSLNGPIDNNFLKLYQIIIRLLLRYKYDVIIIENTTSLNLINKIRKLDKTVTIFSDQALNIYKKSGSQGAEKRSGVSLIERVNAILALCNKKFNLLKKINTTALDEDFLAYSVLERRKNNYIIIKGKPISEKYDWNKFGKFFASYIEGIPENIYKKGGTKIHFLTFASNSFIETLNRIQLEAKHSGFFDTISCVKESDLPLTYRAKYDYMLNENVRGFGYWMWKSYVTKFTLSKINDGDILVYIDAGCTINIEGKKRFYEYIEMLVNSTFSNLSFQLYQMEKEYTKGDLFKYFNVENNKAIKNSGMLMATVFFIKKNDESIKLVDEWYSICHNHKHLIDDSISNYPNDTEFIEHRYDQSIFSLLRKLHGSLIIRDETWFENWKENKHLPIHATRLKKVQ